MFSANVFGAKIRQLAEKWTCPRPPRERLPSRELFHPGVEPSSQFVADGSELAPPPTWRTARRWSDDWRLRPPRSPLTRFPRFRSAQKAERKRGNRAAA